MAKPIGGRVLLKIDGEQVSLRGNITTNIGQKVTRETVNGLDRVHGHLERNAVPFIQCDLTETTAFPLSRLNAVSDGTVIAELVDGRTLVLSNAAQVGDLERNPEEGSIGSVRFEGLRGEEMGGA